MADAACEEMEMIMPIERPLLDILACPIDKQGLLCFEDEAVLYNPRLRRLYRMAGGHLILLADRAEPAPQHEHERLLKRATHGDAVLTGGLTLADLTMTNVAGTDLAGAAGDVQPGSSG